MAIYTTSAKTTEVSAPSHGDKGYNSRGQAVYYNGDTGKWVTSGTWSQLQGGTKVSATKTNLDGSKTNISYTPTGISHTYVDPQGAVTGQQTGLTMDENQAIRQTNVANDWIKRIEELGGTATWDGENYYITDANGQQYRAPQVGGAVWGDLWQAAGLPPTPANPWYGTEENPGPLTVTPDYPNGGPRPGSVTPTPFTPNTGPFTPNVNPVQQPTQQPSQQPTQQTGLFQMGGRTLAEPIQRGWTNHDPMDLLARAIANRGGS